MMKGKTSQSPLKVVVGVDPGLAATGIGIVSGTGRYIRSYAYGSVRTTQKASLPERLGRIFSQLQAVLDRETPDLVVIEDIFSLPRFPRSGISLGEVSGVILLAAGQRGIPTVKVAVREVKQVLTGNGNASKAQLERAVRRLLGCREPIRPDHASDAMGLALIGLYRHASSGGRPGVGPAGLNAPPAGGRTRRVP
jgi:crossover junction endodeoxyribonuclease RuvC